MASIVLKDWDWAGRYWVLDTSSGAARQCGIGVSHGFLSAFPGHDGDAAVQRVAAVYADGGRLWFQVDGTRWEAGDVEFDHTLDASGASMFTVLRHGEVVEDIMYLGPAANPLNRSDPSFDALDMELQDIFCYLARNSRDPVFAAGVLALWDNGVPGED
jgi:hypothetical protein